MACACLTLLSVTRSSNAPARRLLSVTEVLFYHLERASLDAVLPGLLEKTLERGWRACVRCGSRAGAERIDEALWTYTDESFLPHGAASDADAAASQPVWITETEAVHNNANLLFLVDGGRAAADQLSAFDRVVTIFNGHDDDAVDAARSFWKTVRAAGHEATYWKQSATGRWEKQG